MAEDDVFNHVFLASILLHQSLLWTHACLSWGLGWSNFLFSVAGTSEDESLPADMEDEGVG